MQDQATEIRTRCFLVGAGGVGSWLAAALVRLNRFDVVIIDKDKLEPKNLDRQLFDRSEIGRFKAEALAKRYGCGHIPEWFALGLVTPSPDDIIICAADNHRARKAVLETADLYGCVAFLGANEYTDAQSIFYRPEWKGTRGDPRVRHPEINTDEADDPTRPESCTGDASAKTPQLVIANYTAAGFVMQLLWANLVHGPTLPEEARCFMPAEYRASVNRSMSLTLKDLEHEMKKRNSRREAAVEAQH